MTRPQSTYSTLFVDWGGVLTSSVYKAFEVFAQGERLSADELSRAFKENPEARRLLFELECGRLSPTQFEASMCAQLGLPAERASGMIDRMLGAVRVNPRMLALVRQLRRRGIRIGLVSNSWTRNHYDGDVLEQDFDAVLLSAELGVRKPDPGIYHLALDALAVAPEVCVFVDDLGGNLRYARQLGMATVRHEDEISTRRELEALFGVALQ